MKPTFSLLLLLLSALNVSHAQSRNSYEQRHYQGKMIDLTQHSLSELTLSFYSPNAPERSFALGSFKVVGTLNSEGHILGEFQANTFQFTLKGTPLSFKRDPSYRP
jgi:hypothetical protein